MPIWRKDFICLKSFQVAAASATYAHLAQGLYLFEVISGGSRGIWTGAPARLEIRIFPPWCRTNYAYLLYLLIFTDSAWAFYHFQMNKIRLENKLVVEHREVLRLTELGRLKSNFSAVLLELMPDMVMPKNNGYEVAMALKSNPQRIPNRGISALNASGLLLHRESLSPLRTLVMERYDQDQSIC